MNLYSRKQRWKIVLLFIALILTGASLWYSSKIVGKIREDERLRVKIWSEAVRSSVNQLYVTGKLFDKLREDERKNVRRWAKAMQELGKDLNDYTFAMEIVQENKTIPVILTDSKGRYTSALNLDISEDSIRKNLKNARPDQDDVWYRNEARKIFEDTIYKMVDEWKGNYPPIVINFRGKPINTVYYRESKLIAELEEKKDSLSKTFRQELVKNQALVPVIFTDSTKTVVIETNFDSVEIATPGRLDELIAEMSKQNEPIMVRLNENEVGYIFYRDSEVLRQLRLFPYIQLLIISLFILIGYLLFSTFRRAEQNQVWAGMAKETAHQLGTPLSSLIAWLEILKGQGVDSQTISEMNKDIQRLQMVTDRFSKIGSEGKLESTDVQQLIVQSVSYLRPRISSRVEIHIIEEVVPVMAKLNAPLFEWVIENLIKNATDAMEAEGKITIQFSSNLNKVMIDISDTGKGIPHGNFKTIFEPGYTTKKRGWGLGLALAKRIVEYYHKGEIYVLRSEPDKGTTFRIVLNK
ncbi:MAG TPA: HAMP domain-containing sensor histidine kinase [Flavobacteriales bacterium]|nr:HAMP domain-containing sensor histidine kinase [Flavobacteriales bacterium]HRE97795.1 HAMP domain-containing sensor histidine kinase [Flavobacteriales bacterium]HRJ35156.1 HAMP domain-containing sensor histidine kinase [Flavobacteriales bacterium]HRJ37144.1 HAMP domain-containing sensor histidine kinase [Flavobacteriales bacterium]